MATQTQYTVSDILQIVSDLRGESSVNVDAIRIRAVSRAEGDFANRMFWRTHRLDNQTATGDGSSSSFTIGSASYPMRPKGLTEVFVGGTTEDKRYTILDYNSFKNTYNNNNAAKICYEWYDPVNDLWKMRISPTVANGDTITYTYYWQPPERTLTTDVVVCPDPNILALLALGDIYAGEDEEDLANLRKTDAEQIIEQYMGVEEAPAINQLISMGSITDSGRIRGIGTY